MPVRMSEQGFTLLELMITLTVLVVLVTLGVPSFSQQIQASRLKNATNELFQATHLARSRAVYSNSRVTLRALGDWEQGWRVFYDPNHNGRWDTGEPLIAEQGPNSRVRISGSRTVQSYISFIGTGEGRFATGGPRGGFQAGTLTLCSKEGQRDGYQLILSRGGRMRQETVESSQC